MDEKIGETHLALLVGIDSMDYGIRSGKSISLGIPKAPQGNIQGHK